MKKELKKMLASALCVAMLGCSGVCGTASVQAAEEEFTISFWTTGDVGINPQIEEWNGIHPNQKIEMVTADSETLIANLKTALTAGSGLPDAVWVECDSIENFKQNPDLWANLLDYGAGDMEKDYLPWKWQQALSKDGKQLFGIPTDVGPMLIAYRTDIFEEAGLPTDREEVSKLLATWDDYMEVGKILKEKTGSYILNESAYLFQVMVGQGEEKFFDTEENCIVETNAGGKSLGMCKQSSRRGNFRKYDFMVF